MVSDEDINEIVRRTKGDDLSEEDQKMMSRYLDESLEKLHKEHPEKYLEFLKALNEAMTDLNQSFEKLKTAREESN